MWKITTLLCALVGATLPLSLFPGSLATGLAGAVASVVLIGAFLAIRPGELAFLQAAGAMFLFVGLIPPLFILLQMLPISPLAHPVWKQATDALGQPLGGGISIDTGASLRTLLTYLTGFATAIAAAAIAVDPLRVKWLSNAILGATVGLALLISIEPAVLAWFRLPASAGKGSQQILLVLIGIQFGTALLLEGLDKWRGRRSARIPLDLILAIAAVVIGLAAMAWRAGSAGAVATLTGCAFILMIWLSKNFRIPLLASGIIMVTLSGIAVAAAVAFRRHPAVPLAIGFVAAPDEAIQLSLSVLADVPFFGTGAGTIDALLPTYADLQQFDLPPAMSSAASALMAEYGVLIFWSMIAAGVAMTAIFLAGALDRGRDWSFAASATGVLIGLMVAAFTLPTLMSVTGVIVFGTVVGSAVAQRISRSRTRIG